MSRLVADIVILGGGFGGCLTALIARQIGLRAIIIEGGRHPRFAIGESSTPIAGAVLRHLAQTYELPQLLALSRYGLWRKSVPDLLCGVKRGFSYFAHERDRAFVPSERHDNELLVTASADDEHSDTHWYRSDVDAWLVNEARSLGVEVLEQVHLSGLRGTHPWVLEGVQSERPLVVQGDFLVDATGGVGLLPDWFSLRSTVDCLRTRSWAIYSHFQGVKRWNEWLDGNHPMLQDHPFCCDHAALHHWLDGAWMWNLRFDDERVSAGIVMDIRRHPIDQGRAPQEQWQTWLQRYPALAESYSNARLADPPGALLRTGRLQRLWEKAAADSWALLPHTAGFIDPLHSTGIAHTLCGVERLAAIWASSWGHANMAEKLSDYDRIVRSELLLVDQLVSGCYAAPNFSVLAAFTMLYFAAATTYERGRHVAAGTFGSAFLCADSTAWRQTVASVREWLDRLGSQPGARDVLRFEQRVADAIGPFNQVGLFAPAIRNMYRYTAAPVDGHS